MVGVVSLKDILSGWLDDGALDFEGLCASEGGSLGAVFDLKNPFRVFCPAADGAGAGVIVDFDRLRVVGAVSFFSDLLRVSP